MIQENKTTSVTDNVKQVEKEDKREVNKGINEKTVMNNNLSDFGDVKINKKGFIEISGEVIETLPSITFRVKLENGQEILARLSGKMRMHRIMLLPGDKVKVEMSPYDLTKGRITYRF